MAEDELFTDDVVAPSPSWEVMLRRGFAKHCPRCATGHLYRGWFRMKERCPGCGMKFEREPGYFTGAYLINFAVTEVFMFLVLMGFIFALSRDAHASMVPPLVVGGLFAVLGPIIGYPWARTIWSAIDLAMRPLELDEIVAARDHMASARGHEPPDATSRKPPDAPAAPTVDAGGTTPSDGPGTAWERPEP